MSSIHIVAKGDNLTKIAKRYAIPVIELRNINDLPDPNKLRIGQKLRLRKEKVLGFQALMLDRDRNPIEGLAYQFDFAGRVIKGVTGLNGLTRQIMTPTPQDQVRILVERLDKSLKEVASVTSGYGNKLVTLISPSVKIEVKTELHPDLKPGQLPNRKEKTKPIYDPKAIQPPTADKKNFGLKATAIKTPDAKPLLIVEGDIPDLSFLGEYMGGAITEEDIEAAAKELDCNASLLYAIARQESGHSSFIRIADRFVPTILYERHQFSKYSKKIYDETHPDISGLAYRRARKNKFGEWIEIKTSNKVSESEIYGRSGFDQYKRLVKAYCLDQDAALKACSWGKFQIMGFNYSTAGFESVHAFVKAMSKSDAEHMKAFLKFAKKNKILMDGLRNSNYELIAEGHNGGSWQLINPEYAKNIKKFSSEYKNIR